MNLSPGKTIDDRAAEIREQKRELDKMIRQITKSSEDFVAPKGQRYLVSLALLHEYFSLDEQAKELDEMKQLLKTEAEKENTNNDE